MQEVRAVRGHHFVEVRNSTRSACDVCSKTLPLAILTGGIYECKRKLYLFHYFYVCFGTQDVI